MMARFLLKIKLLWLLSSFTFLLFNNIFVSLDEVAAQNCSATKPGAFTGKYKWFEFLICFTTSFCHLGEVSAEAVKDLGLNWLESVLSSAVLLNFVPL